MFKLIACCHAKSAANAFSSNDRLLQVCRTLSNPIAKHLQQCDPADADGCAVYAAKFFILNGKKVALCRVLCGTVRTGDQFNVMDVGKENSDEASQNVLTVKGVYIVLGRELVAVDGAPAGRICAMESEGGWFGGHLLCSGGLSKVGKDGVVRFDFFEETAVPLVRVTIQLNRVGSEHRTELRACLKQLAVLDGAVRVIEQENGDVALITAGEVHLQKCLKDLSDLGQTDVTVSEPIVPFLETFSRYHFA